MHAQTDGASLGVAKVHIIDDDALVRRAIVDLIESVSLKAASYASASEFLNDSLFEGPGCIVLDVRLPGTNGLEFQGRLRQRQVHLPVIFVSGFGDIPMTVKAMRAGAIDFLPKPFRDQDLIDAVTTAIEMDARRLAAVARNSVVQQRFHALTAREQSVMTLSTRGLLNKQVAAELSIAEATVKIHRRNAMSKMQAASFAELVRMAESLCVHGARNAEEHDSSSMTR